MALARASCLYCGGPLEGREAAAVPPAPAAAAQAPAPPERDVIVLDLGGVAAVALADALGLPPFEAELRSRRGGYQLHRIVAPALAREEAEKLRAAGLRVFVVPEAEARTAAAPYVALGGTLEEGGMALRGPSGPRRVAAADLLLVVRGTIARAVEASSRRRRVRTAGPSDGQRIHLHLRADSSPVEIDPDDFERGASPLPGSSLVAVLDWVRALARERPVDDGFRHLSPALAPALPPPAGASAVLESLGTAPARKDPRPVLLDNLAQFRFYSGWRAAVERRRD